MPHTKLPWHFSRKFRYVSDINHNVIAEMAPLHGFEADAAFIVHAANNHYPLVKALEVARERIEAEVELMEPGWKSAKRVLDYIDAALSAAKGET